MSYKRREEKQKKKQQIREAEKRREEKTRCTLVGQELVLVQADVWEEVNQCSRYTIVVIGQHMLHVLIHD